MMNNYSTIPAEKLPMVTAAVDALMAAGRIFSPWIYVIDRRTGVFVHCPEGFASDTGNSETDIREQGVHLLTGPIVDEDKALLPEIKKACEQAWREANDEERRTMTVSVSMRAFVSGNLFTLNYSVSVLMLGDDGKPWLDICVVGPSVRKEVGHVRITLGRRSMAYSFTDHQWTPLPTFHHLTFDERNVLVHSANGLTVEEISKRMFRAPITIKKYRSSICEKLGVSNITEAIYCASKYNLF